MNLILEQALGLDERIQNVIVLADDHGSELCRQHIGFAMHDKYVSQFKQQVEAEGDYQLVQLFVSDVDRLSGRRVHVAPLVAVDLVLNGMVLGVERVLIRLIYQGCFDQVGELLHELVSLLLVVVGKM